MANKLFPLGRQSFLAGSTDWDAHDFKIGFFPAGYVYDAAHDNLDDVTGMAAAVATSGNLASKTNTLGTADAADFTLSAVSGSVITQAVLYRDTGTPSTSTLIAHYDTGGFPTTPNGGDINVTINASGLFTL
jgi:hypothetical protein